MSSYKDIISKSSGSFTEEGKKDLFVTVFDKKYKKGCVTKKIPNTAENRRLVTVKFGQPEVQKNKKTGNKRFVWY